MKPELIAFHGPDCDLCDEMEPFMKKVEKELGKRILRFDVASSKNYNLDAPGPREPLQRASYFTTGRTTGRSAAPRPTTTSKWASGDSGVKEFFSPRQQGVRGGHRAQHRLQGRIRQAPGED